MTTVFDDVGPSPSIVCSVRSCIAAGTASHGCCGRGQVLRREPVAFRLGYCGPFLAFSSSLAGHDLLEVLRHADVLQADTRHFQAPFLGLFLDDFLDQLADAVSRSASSSSSVTPPTTSRRAV